MVGFLKDKLIILITNKGKGNDAKCRWYEEGETCSTTVRPINEDDVEIRTIYKKFLARGEGNLSEVTEVNNRYGYIQIFGEQPNQDDSGNISGAGIVESKKI